jgi:anti-sigma B factor antagonist
VGNDLEPAVNAGYSSPVVVSVAGEVDLNTAPQLRDKLAEVTSRKAEVVIVDLGAVEFLDSTGLGVILTAWKEVTAQGCALAVVSPQPRITRIFEITGLNLSIPVCVSLEAAIAAVNNARAT